MADPPVITRLRPIAIAHRAGNDLDALREAEAAGIDLVECDIWPYRGHLEVRHLKTFGSAPIPLLWDREGWRHWRVAAGWRPRLHLRELLGARGERTELMLDLKGNDLRLPASILEARHEAQGDPNGASPLTVCSQNWALLEPFRREPDIAVVHSVGNTGQLQRLEAMEGVTAVSIHRRLLSEAVAARLHERGCFIMTWSVATWPEAQTLLDRGADGIISSHLDVLRQVMAVRNERAAS